jgi:tryptophanyl-tRNA synthetase
MSKSYNNFINIFDDEKKLKKSINSIKNEPATLEEPKDPDTCNIVNIFKLVANEEQIQDICYKYRNGNYGHSQAKNYLYEVILERFKNERERFYTYKKEPQIIYDILVN